MSPWELASGDEEAANAFPWIHSISLWHYRELLRPLTRSRTPRKTAHTTRSAALPVAPPTAALPSQAMPAIAKVLVIGSAISRVQHPVTRSPAVFQPDADDVRTPDRHHVHGAATAALRAHWAGGAPTGVSEPETRQLSDVPVAGIVRPPEMTAPWVLPFDRLHSGHDAWPFSTVVPPPWDQAVR